MGLIRVRVKIKVRTWGSMKVFTNVQRADRFLITLLVIAPYRLFNLRQPVFQRGRVTGDSAPTGVGEGGGIDEK